MDDFSDIIWAVFIGASTFWPVVVLVWLIIHGKNCKDLDRRVSGLEGRNNPFPWINIEARVPVQHGFYEVMTEEGYPRQLVTKVIRFDGNVGGIKFWRMIKEAGK